MNDKKFTKTKVRKSLKKLLNKQYASGQELRRINLLGEIVASLLLGGESKVSKISGNMNAGRRKLESVKKQVSRFFRTGTLVQSTNICPSWKGCCWR